METALLKSPSGLSACSAQEAVSFLELQEAVSDEEQEKPKREA